MSRSLWFVFAGVVLLGAAAAAAVLVLTDPDRGRAPAAVRTVVPQAALRPPPVAASPLPTPSPPLPPAQAPSLQAVQPGEPPPGAAAYQSPEERADALVDMQQRRMTRGMDALNERGERRAAQARPAPSRAPSR